MKKAILVAFLVGSVGAALPSYAGLSTSPSVKGPVNGIGTSPSVTPPQGIGTSPSVPKGAATAPMGFGTSPSVKGPVNGIGTSPSIKPPQGIGTSPSIVRSTKGSR